MGVRGRTGAREGPRGEGAGRACEEEFGLREEGGRYVEAEGVGIAREDEAGVGVNRVGV